MAPRTFVQPKWFLLPLFVTLLCLGLDANPQSKKRNKGDPVLGERIAEGIVFSGHLWLRGAMAAHDDPSGGLISLDLSSEARSVHYEKGVLDIEKAGSTLWVLRTASSTKNEFVVSIWSKGVFENLAQFESSPEDRPIALLSAKGIPVVLLNKSFRKYSHEGRAWHREPLKGGLRAGVQVSVAVPNDAHAVYVGINRGEWGGGLQRVDLGTGTVTDVERCDSPELCEGPLNSDCDPVTGVIPDPLNESCVLAAIGLRHFVSHGRILRVCGERVTLVSEIVVRQEPCWKHKETEAFFGLTPSADGGFLAIGGEALYAFVPDGTRAERHTLPKPRRASGMFMSREISGVLVLWTDVNWAVSVSGYTPLLISLEPPRSGK